MQCTIRAASRLWSGTGRHESTEIRQMKYRGTTQVDLKPGFDGGLELLAKVLVDELGNRVRKRHVLHGGKRVRLKASEK